MAKTKYIGNVFATTKKGEDGKRVAVEGEFNLCVNIAEGETLVLKKGDYINFRTPAAHYGGLAERGYITREVADVKIQEAIAANIRLIPVVNAKSAENNKQANVSGF